MTPQNAHFTTYPLIELLQIHTESQANEFQRQWKHEIDYMRFEEVFLPDSPQKTLAIDLILRSKDKDTNENHLLLILGILVKENEILFPSIIKEWSKENLAFLSDTIQTNILTGFKNFEIRPLHVAPHLPVEEMTIERAMPSLCDYATVVHHIKRYTFLLDHILPGNILECACGTGYGASILARLAEVTKYDGTDLSDIAVSWARSHGLDKRFDFHVADLAEFKSNSYKNVISLETIEHTTNPYRFIELLIDKMTPDGQLLLSLPAEAWGGSHLNPYHLTNWNWKRLTTFLEQYFEDITVFTQRLSLQGPTTFEASSISGDAPNEDNDECFISILRRPRKKKRPNIILKRYWAMGDVIWATPILRELRRCYPHYNLLVLTRKTEVFMHNPDTDLVVNDQYEPLSDDLLIDLDWTYESRRKLHILHAYAEASGLPVTSAQPVLCPTKGEFHFSATLILHYFQHQKIKRLIAVHMAANSPNRIWPKAHWKRFITNLLEQDKKLGIVILGHGNDFSAADIGFSADHRVLCLARRLSLMHTAAVLSLCDLLVAPDSGVLHIAAAVSVPYLGLFSMAVPETRLPFTTGSRAIWANIECRGCLQNIAPRDSVRCPHGNPECMEQISPKEVLMTSVRMLEAVLPGRWKIRCQMAFLGKVTDDAGQSPNPLNVGIAAFESDDFETAIDSLSTAMAGEPENPLPCAYLAFICAQQGLTAEAHNFIAQSARLAPERGDLVAALGEVFLRNDRPSEALKYLREAVQIQPDLFAAYPALAQSLHLTGQSGEAISLLQTVANLPSGAQASIQNVLLQILAECGDLSEFTKYTLRFSQGLSDELLAARNLARFDENGETFLETLSRIQARLEELIHSNPNHANTTQSGLTRIAFMVGDFTSHHQFEQLFALLRYLPPERFFTLIICTSLSRLAQFEMIQMCSMLADTAENIKEDEDNRALEKIRALAPDILVDMEVYAPLGRLTVFLAAPVPHKLLWGEAPMPPIAPDVRTLAGAHVESILPTVNLPGTGEVFDLPELPFTDDAARKTGKPPVLGCLVPAAGMGRDGWQLLAETLSRHPDATLVINLKELGQAAQTFISGQFSGAGVDCARLVFISARTTEDFCLAWQSIDLGLLPPVNPGGLALPTCLWMGKPCLALASILPWSQRPAALLKALGKEEWIALDIPHYVDLARQLAPPGQRVKPDPALRERMKAQGLTDSKAFAQGFAEAMTGLSRSGHTLVSSDEQ